MVDLLKFSGKVILLGNQAIVRGALESGVGFSASYPGTPSSEIADTFAKIAKKAGIYFEYSTNEKVASEAVAGASFSGVRSLVSFKHFGFNVASDSIYPLAYHGVDAGLVIVCSDDPGCHSSGQSEQDSRYMARIAHMPLLEPSDPTECKEFTKLAFEMSEKLKIPVIVRTTTRVAHASEVVKLGKIVKGKTKGVFKKGRAFRNLPPNMLGVHAELDKKLENLKSFTKTVTGKGSVGVITSGVSYHYVMEALRMLNLKIPVLKLNMTWPLAEQEIKNFVKGLKSVLVVEELDGVIERDVRGIKPNLSVHGKDHLPSCELNQDVVAKALAKLTKKSFKAVSKEVDVPSRPPILCPGCPHRATFWAVKKAVPKNTVFGGDIGCYLLGIYEPNNTADFLISMGAGCGIVHGINKVEGKKPVAFIGDSTFFHAGLPPIVNHVYNKSNVLTVVLDNRWTAMTGHQPNPAMGLTGMGDQTKEIKIEEVVKGLGVENVDLSNSFNLKDTKGKAKELFKKNGASVLVSKGECRLQFMRRARSKGVKVPVFEIDKKKCTKCGICLYDYGCPAIQRDKKGDYFIDPDLCWGCSACMQVCPVNAISIKK
ncbi:indolepyruvate ferredoxin oxidoreductase subunit alpha [Nanoarchaeota archaeon]